MKKREEILPLALPEGISFSKDHYPVLVREVLGAFSEFKNRPLDQDLHYFDGTFGRGGHFQTMLAYLPQLRATLVDQDLQAIEFGKRNYSTLVESGKIRFFHANFSEFSEQNFGSFDMMLLDLGVSSPQLDQADRGFSFYNDGPLDMRMNQNQRFSAADIINAATEEELNEIFRELGEIQRPGRVIRAIVHDRKEKAFTTTRELAGLIERVDGWNKKGHHPATRYFMALRLRVNAELDVLEQALPAMIRSLKPKGRLCVISFHSLEDRIVKNIFRDFPEWGGPVTKKVIIPTDEECEMNSRSRSAKLRVFERWDPAEIAEVQDERNRYRNKS